MAQTQKCSSRPLIRRLTGESETSESRSVTSGLLGFFVSMVTYVRGCPKPDRDLNPEWGIFRLGTWHFLAKNGQVKFFGHSPAKSSLQRPRRIHTSRIPSRRKPARGSPSAPPRRDTELLMPRRAVLRRRSPQQWCGRVGGQAQQARGIWRGGDRCTNGSTLFFSFLFKVGVPFA